MPEKTDAVTPATPTEAPAEPKTITLPLDYVLALEDAANALSDLLVTGVSVENAKTAETAIEALDPLAEQLTAEQKEQLGLD